jgi:radical SAM protein with 4Fe4S-binding SPASM domain
MKNQKLFIIEELFGCRIYDSHNQKEYLFNKRITGTIKKYLKYQNKAIIFNKIKSLCHKDFVSTDITLISNKSRIGLSAPSKISFNLTRNCNLRCKHCLNNAGYSDDNELTKDDLFKLFDELVGIGTFFITFGGGEPLTRKDLFEIIRYARSKCIAVSLVTNSLLIDKKIAQKLNSLSLHTISVSLDGLRKNHDYIRGRGSFNKTLIKLKLLRKYIKTAQLAIRVTINSQNIDDCEALIKIAEDLSFDLIRLTPVLPFGRALENLDLLLSQDQFAKFIKKCERLRSKSKIKIVLPSDEENPLNSANGDFGCHCGKEACWVSQTGDVSPCLFFGDAYTIGNIKEKPFLILWRKAKNKVILSGNKICNHCSNYVNCRGGCRARALWQNNNINAVDPYCLLRKNKAF